MSSTRTGTLFWLALLAYVGAAAFAELSDPDSGTAASGGVTSTPGAPALAMTGEGRTAVPPATSRAPVEPPAAKPVLPLTRSERRIQRGEPLDTALRRLELAPAERAATVAALGDVVDLRRILPGETVEIARADDGALREVTLQRDPLHSVAVRFPGAGDPVVETLERDVDVHVRRIEGNVNGSLYDGVIAAGGDANLTMRFADLLSWQVDFLTEPRAGDRFLIVVREEFLDGERLGFGKILAAEYGGDRAEARAVRYVDEDGNLDWYDDDGRSVRRAFLKSPLSFRRISSRFTASRRHPILKTVRPHWGVDYAAPRGTPVSALGDGVVRFAGRRGGYGNYVEVRHNATYTTCYGHLSGFAKGIRPGRKVEQGDVVGYVGSTGLSTGPHLDFRVKRNGHFVDPLKLDSPPGRALTGSGLDRYERYRDRAWDLAQKLPAGESVPERLAWAMLGLRAPAEAVMAHTSPLVPPLRMSSVDMPRLGP